jgi:arginine deiminase
MGYHHGDENELVDGIDEDDDGKNTLNVSSEKIVYFKRNSGN